MDKRGAGILLHISSLPSEFGIGDVGPKAYKFADFLYNSGMRFWQILPLNPTDFCHDNSPYKSVSAFAFNPNLISPITLVEDGLLEGKDIIDAPRCRGSEIDYTSVVVYKERILNKAYDNFVKKPNDSDFDTFCRENSYWLDDYALFSALKEKFSDRIWNQWPAAIRDRDLEEIKKQTEVLHKEIKRKKFFQYLFIIQWRKLKKYCNHRNIQIIGDIPIYVGLDSVDVWTHSSLFKLDKHKQPIYVAGVPPDYFSETGQLWGNPVYRWDVMKKNKYKWWLERLRHNLALFDIVRIDHFRGLVAYWQVDSKEKTAINGKWIKTPADDFLHTIVNKFDKLPIIAEDLGVITPDVLDIMKKYNLPGMKVLQFGFSGDVGGNEHAVHNAVPNSFLFTGTHDNNTVRGWYRHDIDRKEKQNIDKYVGHKVTKRSVHKELIRLAMMSVANTVIIPLQDILGLGREARMNRPFSNKGNWRWKLKPGNLTDSLSRSIKELIAIYGR